MLSERKQRILKTIVQQYINAATPVPSEVIARNYGMAVSSATVRNEMAQLEEEGYIIQPHPSAGRMPSAKGYRYYVEVLLEEQGLTQEERFSIENQFSHSGKLIEEWIHISATILTQMLHNVAIVTLPRNVEPQIKFVELLSLRDFLALLILVFQNATFKQKVIALDESLTQEDLNSIAHKLTGAYKGMNVSEIKLKLNELSETEKNTLKELIGLMDKETMQEIGEAHFDGLSLMLSQPEFAKQGDKARILFELLEEKTALNPILSKAAGSHQMQVIIGDEIPHSAMQDFSLVLGQYGLSEKASGVIGVVGPTRMAYEKAFSVIRFLSSTMNKMIHELYYK